MQDEKAIKQKALGEFKALPTKLGKCCKHDFFPHSLTFTAQQETKLAEAQQSIESMKERLRALEDKHDAVTMERGRVALQYAVCQITYLLEMQY